ncbi:helix-turn-helix domain-containing protein [Dankookia sp. GCM10030260]|uniref:helix-turn-helix domain-containing protein n=1 Tax=Dankookia sp. GCM10030260 TaxID=3273390 RepID=UPI0036157D2C
MRREGSFTVRHTEIDLSAQLLASNALEVVPLPGGPFRTEAAGFALGDLDMLVGRVSPVLLHGVVPIDRVWVVFPITPFLINGRRAAPPMLTVLGEGAVLDCTNHAEAEWAMVSLHIELAQRTLELPGRSPRPGLGTEMMLACDPNLWPQSIQLMQSAVEVAAEDAAVFEVAEARRSLRSSVLEMLQDLLGGLSGGVRPRILRAPAERQRLIEAVEDLLCGYPAQAPTTAGLAASLGMSVPRLRRAIRTRYGMGLQRLLLLRRLIRFDKALRSAGPNGPTPQQLASTHGFSDFNELEREYRKVFSMGFQPLDRDGGGSSAGPAAMLPLAAD